MSNDEVEANIEMIMDDGGFTREESICINHIVQAWNIYSTLPIQHNNELGDFLIAIDRLQDLMMRRVSRREHPKMWPLRLK